MILAVLCCSLPLSDQVLGDLGLTLQPGQPRLLVHGSYLLAAGQSRAHDRDDLTVGPLTALTMAYGSSPSFRAWATAWVRLATPSLSKMWLRCFFTVSWVTTSSSAIARLGAPAASS